MADEKARSVHELLAEYREKQATFERRCWEQWKPAFDLYDWVLLQAQNAAAFFLKHHRDEAVDQQDALYEAQTRLQARAYRTACEVRALLLSGNPDGALARWRTIHEILVVMLFLQKYGAETAERFLKYDLIQTAKNWGQYEQLPQEWQILPVTPEEGVQAKDERAKAVQEYDLSFQKDNGWAAHALGRSGKDVHITIADLEKVVGLERFRFYYNVAGNHIHVNMKGLANDFRADLFPSLQGFTAAACTTIMGLADCTVIMAKLRPTPDTEVLEKQLEQAASDANQVFLQIHQRIEQEERDAAEPAQ